MRCDTRVCNTKHCHTLCLVLPLSGISEKLELRAYSAPTASGLHQNRVLQVLGDHAVYSPRYTCLPLPQLRSAFRSCCGQEERETAWKTILSGFPFSSPRETVVLGGGRGRRRRGEPLEKQGKKGREVPHFPGGAFRPEWKVAAVGPLPAEAQEGELGDFQPP